MEKANNNKEITKRFRRYLRLERSYSEHTMDAYMRDIDKLQSFISSEKGGEGAAESKSLLKVTLQDLQAFLALIV